MEIQYKTDFEKCVSLKDYEDYVIKYYRAEDNPYLEQAKQKIAQTAKVKSDNSLGFAITMAVITYIGSALLIIFGSSDAENETDRTAYMIIAGVVCLPFIFFATKNLIKSIIVNRQNP